jgi:DNA sulfur modification protein DndB
MAVTCPELDPLEEGLTATFPVMRGFVGDTEYYSAILTFGEAARMIQFVADVDGWGSQTDARAKTQRQLNETRVERELVPYLLEHTDHFYGAVVAEMRPLPGHDGGVRFTSDRVDPSGLAVGQLELDGTVALCALDGQHRLRSIQLALREVPSLASEHIAVVLVPFRSTRRSQLLFADLNRFARTPSRSLTLLFSHRDPVVRLANEVINLVPLLGDRVELESTTLARFSPRFVTFSTLYEMTKTLIQGHAGGSRAEMIREAHRQAAVWAALTEAVDEWAAVADNSEHPAYLRPRSLAMHGAGQQAIAHVAKRLTAGGVARLSEIDWSIANPSWQGIAVQGARVFNTPGSISSLAAAVLFELGLPIDRQSAANLGTLIRARGDSPPDQLAAIAAGQEVSAS